MSFKEIHIKDEYRSLKDNITNEFYIPLLQDSVVYKRAVGYFSSSALIEISKGISGLVANHGKIQLVASPFLTDEDLEAIRKGYELRDSIIEKVLVSSLDIHSNYFEKSRLNLLANLIADGVIDIKIAFTDSMSQVGMYHEKMGLLYDKDGNIVAFAGSMNETRTAMLHNYESIDVFCSWTSDVERVKTKENAFSAIWNNTESNIQVVDFKRIKKEIIEKYKYGPMNLNIDKEEFCDINHNLAEIKNKNTLNIPPYIKLHDYQIEAIDEWERKEFRGIFDMATGTGKTIAGLSAVVRLRQHYTDKLAVIIVCPYQHLVEQWVEDIIEYNIQPIVGYSSSSQRDWKKRLSNSILDQSLNVDDAEFICFICTNATFQSAFVQNQIIKIKSEVLLLIDEAHNFGSNILSSKLTDKYRFRLALSATFDRHNDEEGTAKLYEFFGDKCIEYTLERAIKEKKLTQYKYYPIIVTLTTKELERYLYLSQEIGKCIIKSKSGKSKLSKKGEMLTLERARLVAAAEYKIINLKECIMPYCKKNHILVYCGAATLLGEQDDFTPIAESDIRQIDAVTNLLGNELNMKVSQFTSKENIQEREILKKEFEKGEHLQALIAIKCLDEGVNIPMIKVAFILASTTNPKEYIQRRGRVLRLADDKPFAEIYDFIAIPRPLNEVSSLTVDQMKRDLPLVKRELNRVKEFSSIAMNTMESDEVICKIKDAYGLNDEDIEFIIE